MKAAKNAARLIFFGGVILFIEWGILAAITGQDPFWTPVSVARQGVLAMWVVYAIIVSVFQLRLWLCALIALFLFGASWVFRAAIPHIEAGSFRWDIFWYGAQPVLFASFLFWPVVIIRAIEKSLAGSRNSSGDRKRGRGFTIVELLVATAVLVILCALLFPIVVGAMRKAKQTTCSTQLRQLGLSLTMYADAYDGLAPDTIGAAMTIAPKAQTLKFCPLDAFIPDGYWCQMVEFSPGNLSCRDATSYLYLFGQACPLDGKRALLADGNSTFPALVVCVLHGQESAELYPGTPQLRGGLALRCLRDGSVQVRNVPLLRQRSGSSSWTMMNVYGLFRD